MRYTIGVDTGGTYTDAVVIDMHQRQVLASAKSLTTRGDLSVGISRALAAVLNDAGSALDRTQIAHLALSTTLATNALVEGHGSSVTSVLIGFDDRMVERTGIAQALPSAHVVRVRGGHQYTGEEHTALDEDALRTALQSEPGKSEAFAVTSNYAVRNPEHEHRAKALIGTLTSCPVTASSDLTDALNGPRRALTATFNARIVSLIVRLEQAVRRAMSALDIEAPIMIVKGDGAIASVKTVIEKPIETILSGPAASVIGARFLSGLSNFVISDIGGTTTDIATVRDGWPNLNNAGSQIGEYRTLVRAIDMTTYGLGGDSEVLAESDGQINLSASRVIPIALLAARFPAVLSALRTALGQTSGMLGAIRYLVRPDGAESIQYPQDLTPEDRSFLRQFDANEPVLYGRSVIKAADRARVTRLLTRGVLQQSGLTPSDAAHVLGRQSQWSRDGARAACELVGRGSGWVSGPGTSGVDAFAQAIFDTLASKSTRVVLDQLIGQPGTAAADTVVDAMARGQTQLGDLQLSMRPAVPVVAVGGPAGVFYTEVGRRLGRECVVPAHSDVANAIGAAVGLIKTRAVAEITYNEEGGYRVHGNGPPEFHSTPASALTAAEQIARSEASELAQSMGAVDVVLEVDIRRIDIPGTSPATGLMSATVTAQCTGTPGNSTNLLESTGTHSTAV